MHHGGGGHRHRADPRSPSTSTHSTQHTNLKHRHQRPTATARPRATCAPCTTMRHRSSRTAVSGTGASRPAPVTVSQAHVDRMVGGDDDGYGGLLCALVTSRDAGRNRESMRVWCVRESSSLPWGFICFSCGRYSVSSNEYHHSPPSNTSLVPSQCLGSSSGGTITPAIPISAVVKSTEIAFTFSLLSTSTPHTRSTLSSSHAHTRTQPTAQTASITHQRKHKEHHSFARQSCTSTLTHPFREATSDGTIHFLSVS